MVPFGHHNPRAGGHLGTDAPVIGRDCGALFPTSVAHTLIQHCQGICKECWSTRTRRTLEGGNNG